MRIFQSEKQIVVSIRLNAFGELFSAGEPSVSERNLKHITRKTLKEESQDDSLPEAQLWHPGGACATRDGSDQHDGDRRGSHVSHPDADRNYGHHRSRFLAHHSPLSGVSLLKAKGRLLPFIENFEQKLMYISLIE